MKISKILENIKYIKVYNEMDAKINNFSSDTRDILENDLYIAIKGETFNGNLFYMDAFLKGATCAVVTEVIEVDESYLKENNKCLILIDNIEDFLKDLAIYKRSTLNVPVIAITGSAGKTSTKDITHSILNEKYVAYKTEGNKNNHYGLPKTILNIKGEEIIVLEMGMNHFGEISYLTNIAKPDAVIINNIGTAHIGNLGSRENILKAKLEILEGLKDGGLVVINNDDDLLNKWAIENKDKYNIKTYGINNDSDIMAYDIKTFEDHNEFTVNNINLILPVPGVAYVYNSLAAITLAKEYGAIDENIINGLKNFKLSSNRMELITKDNINYINDVYNANYDAVKYAIKHLTDFKGRTIACLGTMKELGEYSKDLHSKIGESIVENNIDILVTVGEDTNFINEEAIKLGFNQNNSYHFNLNEEASILINEIKTEGDTILIKASASCKFKEIIEKIID